MNQLVLDEIVNRLIVEDCGSLEIVNEITALDVDNVSRGAQGPAGADGVDGATGPQGPTGPAGADGADGATGPQGPTGPAGADGADGATGPQGLTGATGPQGPAGSSGSGFIDYNNTDTGTTLVADTWTALPNDGLGSFSNSSYPPNSVTYLMDTSVGKFDFSELSLGDTALIRNDYTVTPSTNNALLELRYTLGTGVGAYTLQKVVQRLDDGSGKGYRFSLTPDLIYMGDTNTKDNLVGLEIKLSTNGTVDNAGSVIQVIKR